MPCVPECILLSLDFSTVHLSALDYQRSVKTGADSGVNIISHQSPRDIHERWESGLFQRTTGRLLIKVVSFEQHTAIYSGFFPACLSPQRGLPSTTIHTCSASALELTCSSSARHQTLYQLRSGLQSLLGRLSVH